ncbi:MAG: hypothetical protein AVDCRST_MAG25-1196 [uncultured Rubrobacteraceae bacterium]|uniref:Uncharacterized protein n=1 Tax=uncultured Rubrobacteraceae bacterium TaxID=349277 RepID=A0A6J4R3Y4_9ACTN|nr:MAG: hypothetical protein AVDCRST_MAG25-1196 [uncultured Rubrobacteraceae bacterium]
MLASAGIQDAEPARDDPRPGRDRPEGGREDAAAVYPARPGGCPVQEYRRSGITQPLRLS